MEHPILEDRVKVRLTGAAILVALVVLLVPEVFRGERPLAPVPGESPGDGAPLRSYTIDLEASDARAPATVNDEPAAAVIAAPVVETPANKPPDMSASAAAPTAAPAVAPAIVAPVTAPAVASAPPPPTTEPAAPSAVRAGWVVQLGTFSRRENAERMAEQAAKKGLRLAVAGPDDRGLYRVRSTSIFTDRQSAAALQERLKALGYPGMVNTSQ